MKINLDTPADDGRIELLPLIDVVFCILTFFILAALQLTRQQAINVDLPKASTGETQMQKMLIVGVDPQGKTYLDQQPVNMEQLQRSLKRFLRWNPSGLVVLYAPKDAKYNDVVQVLDQLRAIGGDRVALATLPSSVELPTNTDPNNPTSNDDNPLLPSYPSDSNSPPAPPNPFLLSPTPSEQPTSPLLPSQDSPGSSGDLAPSSSP